MDINRRQELIQIYDEKLDTPDRCPHCYVANWTYITADWIKSLDETDRASVYEYIGYILNQAGEFPQKLRTVMMLAEIPCPETEKLMDKMIVEGTSKHTPFIMQYVHSNKMLCEQQKIKEQT